MQLKASLVRLRIRARSSKGDARALYLAVRDPRVPWYVKLFALCIAAYALSPIDLIPDFVPVLGYLDEVILLPLAILLAIKMIPPGIMAEHRAAAVRAETKSSTGGALAIGTIWLVAIALSGWLVWRRLAN